MDIKGLTVEKVLVTEAADIGTEAYVGIIVDRATKKPVFMVSAAGGIDIEEVAATTPEKIKYFPVDPVFGLQSFEAQQLGFFLYQDAKQARAAGKIMQQLYKAFVENGCSLAEINPLVVTPQGEVIAVDAKMVIDDNEIERRPDLEELRDDSSEARARSTRARRTSRSSSSTATSAAWSTAPGSPWRRWTW
jgi:succinyl-CoA synthetase beta subunit